MLLAHVAAEPLERVVGAFERLEIVAVRVAATGVPRERVELVVRGNFLARVLDTDVTERARVVRVVVAAVEADGAALAGRRVTGAGVDDVGLGVAVDHDATAVAAGHRSRGVIARDDDRIAPRSDG